MRNDAGLVRHALRSCLAIALLSLMLSGVGCRRTMLVEPGDRKTISRTLVEYPSGFEFEPYVRNLTTPTAIEWDDQGRMIIVVGGVGGQPVQILRFDPDGRSTVLYPPSRRFIVPGFGFKDFIYGPIGGIVFHEGNLYISHRDADGMGRITALDGDGKPTTIIAGLPAQGEHGVTDLAIKGNRLWFGVGTATNSGVVGLDDWRIGWLRKHPRVCDKLWNYSKSDDGEWVVVLRGLRFDNPNPTAGVFGGPEKAVIGPFQPFDTSDLIRIHIARDGKPNGAIYSVPLTGGSPSEIHIEAHGIRLPRGLIVNDLGRVYATNNGMEMRGARPIKDDADALYWVIPGTWYGWPDFSADLLPITGPRFKPPLELVSETGNREPAPVIDHVASNLPPPKQREELLGAVFESQSGAAKMDFPPAEGPFQALRRRNSVIVAMSGDRAPFSTSGQKLVGFPGRKIVRVAIDDHTVHELIRNTSGMPRSRMKGKPIDALERPVDVKFGPDGAMYVVDMGQVEYKNGYETVTPHTGQIFRLVPVETE